MASWSRQRKSLYALIVIVVLAVAIGVPGFFLFYKAPTCFDGIQNGNEQGIDCGGSCQKLCPSAFLAPIQSWTRFEQVSPGFYNVAAYVINPNPNAIAVRVPYHMALYDDQGVTIRDVYGTMTLPPHRNTLAFQGSVSTEERVPAKAFFEFTASPDWSLAADTLSSLQVTGKDYNEDAAGSSLQVSLHNGSASHIGHLSVYAVLYDSSQNEVGFSKTEIDGIAPGATAVAPYTWPEDRHNAVVSIEVLPVAE